MEQLLKEERKIYSVYELTRDIKLLLEGRFPSVWVEGEATNVRRPSSGHIYFAIKDEKAQLLCVIWRQDNERLKFKLENGLSVLCFGRVGVYERQGQYQLYIERIEPKGIGALQIAFEQLKERLSKEGLFDPVHKKPIPMLPMRIGVVTSSTGAAIRDIINVLMRRFRNIEIILNPVQVQGKGAALEIARAIGEFDDISELTNGEVDKVDVIIVGRGGGSMEDLWAFNEEPVARAIYNAKTPIISAVGHEVDYTISDYAADVRAPTPSAAAEVVVGRKDEFFQRIDALRRRISIQLRHRVEYSGEVLSGLKKRLALLKPIDVIRQYQQDVDGIIERMEYALEHIVELSHSNLKNLRDRLSCLNPASILQRGYSITMRLTPETIIRKASSVGRGEKIKTILAEGEIISEVK